MKTLLALILLISSLPAFSYYTDNYYEYRYRKLNKRRAKKAVETEKPKTETETETKEAPAEVVEVDVETEAEKSNDTAIKICYGLGYVSAASYKVEISQDGKIAHIKSVKCR